MSRFFREHLLCTCYRFEMSAYARRFLVLALVATTSLQCPPPRPPPAEDECPASQVSVGGECRVQCVADTDCAADELCKDKVCLPGGKDGIDCAALDCDADKPKDTCVDDHFKITHTSSCTAADGCQYQEARVECIGCSEAGCGDCEDLCPQKAQGCRIVDSCKPDEADPCTYKDAGAGLVCDVEGSPEGSGDGRCVGGACTFFEGDACMEDGDCEEVGEYCIASACRPQSDLGGLCDVDDQNGGLTDCAEPLVCHEGLCRRADGPCSINADCVTVCVLDACGPRSGFPGACDEEDDCEAALVCKDDACVQDVDVVCVDNEDCAQTCVTLGLGSDSELRLCQAPSALRGVCDAEDSLDCTEPLVCHAQTCRRESGSGDCETNGDCVAACIGGSCVAHATFNAVCDEEADCGDGLTCLIFDDAKRCLRERGTVCATNTECAPVCDEAGENCAMSVCIDDHCAELSGFQGTCGEEDDCEVEFTCSAGSCRNELGAGCSLNTDCDGTCLGSTCRAKSTVGGACDALDHADCDESVCLESFCVQTDLCLANADCPGSRCSNCRTCIGGYCQPWSGVGARCDDALDCVSPPGEPPPSCVTEICRLPQGGYCTANSECINNVCLGLTDLCGTQQDTKAACEETADCLANNTCAAKASPPSKECLLNNDRVCASPSSTDDDSRCLNTCMPQLPVGTTGQNYKCGSPSGWPDVPCTEDEDCGFPCANCTSSTCRADHPYCVAPASRLRTHHCPTTRNECVRYDGARCPNSDYCEQACVNGVCAPFIVAGASCVAPNQDQCAPPATCGAGNLCRLPDTSACTADNQCTNTCVRASASATSGTCGTTTTGGFCSISNTCPSNHACTSGVCLKNNGQSCATNRNSDCVSGACLASNVCGAKIDTGTAGCNDDPDCVSNYCFSGTCRIPSGTACVLASGNAQCGANVCRPTDSDLRLPKCKVQSTVRDYCDDIADCSTTGTSCFDVPTDNVSPITKTCMYPHGYAGCSFTEDCRGGFCETMDQSGGKRCTDERCTCKYPSTDGLTCTTTITGEGRDQEVATSPSGDTDCNDSNEACGGGACKIKLGEECSANSDCASGDCEWSKTTTGSFLLLCTARDCDTCEFYDFSSSQRKPIALGTDQTDANDDDGAGCSGSAKTCDGASRCRTESTSSTGSCSISCSGTSATNCRTLRTDNCNVKVVSGVPHRYVATGNCPSSSLPASCGPPPACSCTEPAP